MKAENNFSLVNTSEDVTSQSEATELINACNIHSDKGHTAAHPSPLVLSVLFCEE